eukprot:354625-Chlamydomonas_euryale.AAC.2
MHAACARACWLACLPVCMHHVCMYKAAPLYYCASIGSAVNTCFFGALAATSCFPKYASMVRLRRCGATIAPISRPRRRRPRTGLSAASSAAARSAARLLSTPLSMRPPSSCRDSPPPVVAPRMRPSLPASSAPALAVLAVRPLEGTALCGRRCKAAPTAPRQPADAARADPGALAVRWWRGCAAVPASSSCRRWSGKCGGSGDECCEG